MLFTVVRQSLVHVPLLCWKAQGIIRIYLTLRNKISEIDVRVPIVDGLAGHVDRLSMDICK